ncbi:hypothetical protein ENU1_087950 [Entamoeba nuttalli P19]|uniref:Selenoprotein F/M domain-containing protein n=1 Tax=Entamoeba nuttalli (strain P19) TaxID=1076696 RepID=K2GZ52_ENTNP|nr:hypothetical protein ENU1_087950 [Entamoeba nuttalli P19]EKE40518.1 hypothetical protein ENU1_087950 [Entamoeba nuttalli P19]|eukprot:XP_008857148.1 hypothetical protein ENU1_087950 [Entamoeba nuttalli P19]
MKIIFIFFFTFAFSQDILIKADVKKYFRAVLNIPPTCTLRTEPGISAFINSKYPNYPMVIKIGSSKTTLEFYDLTNQLLEEINIEGFKKTQIENLLDKRGFYCENPSSFNQQEINEKDFSFNELFEKK